MCQCGNRQCGNYCHTQYVVYYYTHSKNIDKCGKNPQSARRKPNYHTRCGKNCHKVFFVWNGYSFNKLYWGSNILGGDQNLERQNVERPICRNFQIARIKITKVESFDSFIFEILFLFCINSLNN